MQLDLAQDLSSMALSEARARNLPPLAIVVLDERGQIKLAVSEDGTSLFRHKIAQAKANSALGMGMSTRHLYDLFERKILPDRFATAIMFAAEDGFAPQPGGELIISEGQIVGAIGISGASSDDDEYVAKRAIMLALSA